MDRLGWDKSVNELIIVREKEKGLFVLQQRMN